ncbi:hypothetical protein [Nonomuraea jiangxiensis]|uniref:Uncharacterized protein n=1 Tax=Nonomuraea jiangxiensis TaxID=633440 RepID=A0A1G8P1R0_9ACTN|nr:hypothetical protein [Nonomuraea jiangxiensis]SDI86434.1 hypothetical protein SAMN05421869_107301 [Nonomuraea jiangxiensis]
MYKHAIAIFTATSAGVLLAAPPVAAENVAVLPCGNNQVVRITVIAPPELTGDVSVADVRKAVETVVSDTSPASPAVPWWTLPGYARYAFPDPAPLTAPGPDPTPTPSALPSTAPSLPPAPSPSLPAAAPEQSAPAPPAAAPTRPFTFEELVTRTIECVSRNTPPETTDPATSDADFDAVVEAIIASGAVCGTSAVPSNSLLGSIGVSTVIRTLATGIPPCAGPAPEQFIDRPSLRESLGVSGLLVDLIH